MLHASQMAVNVILVYKHGDFCITAKVIVKMSYIKTKQKIAVSTMKEIQGNMIMTGEGVGSYKAGGKRRHPRGGYILET